MIRPLICFFSLKKENRTGHYPKGVQTIQKTNGFFVSLFFFSHTLYIMYTLYNVCIYMLSRSIIYNVDNT